MLLSCTMRTPKEVELIKKCFDEGRNQSETARLLKIPRRTIKDYFTKFKSGIKILSKEDSLQEFLDKLNSENLYGEYSYLLGLYLGDGHIAKTKDLKNGDSVFKLRIFQDQKYINLIEYCSVVMKKLFNNSVSIINRSGCKEILLYKKNLPILFPQHGNGKKHQRKIELEDWQARIVSAYPRPFIKGLIHSDGCRYISQNQIRYDLSNLSEDIHLLFERACNLIGIQTRRHGKNRSQQVPIKNQSILLDSFIGSKS